MHSDISFCSQTSLHFLVCSSPTLSGCAAPFFWGGSAQVSRPPEAMTFKTISQTLAGCLKLKAKKDLIAHLLARGRCARFLMCCLRAETSSKMILLRSRRQVCKSGVPKPNRPWCPISDFIEICLVADFRMRVIQSSIYDCHSSKLSPCLDATV